MAKWHKAEYGPAHGPASHWAIKRGPETIATGITDESKADFMLLACNNHDGLLASLKELFEWMRSHLGPSDGVHQMLVKAHGVIKAAEPEFK